MQYTHSIEKLQQGGQQPAENVNRLHNKTKEGKTYKYGEELKTTEPTKFLNFLVNTRDSTPLIHMQIMFTQMEKYSLYVLKE